MGSGIVKQALFAALHQQSQMHMNCQPHHLFKKEQEEISVLKRRNTLESQLDLKILASSRYRIIASVLCEHAEK